MKLVVPLFFIVRLSMMELPFGSLMWICYTSIVSVKIMWISVWNLLYFVVQMEGCLKYGCAANGNMVFCRLEIGWLNLEDL